MTNAMSYRPDIDGLRAVAVLAVMLYHFGVDNLPGGFVGVDIFFVISGYLITKILIHEIASGQFSYVNFYMRRIRRIVPVFVLVVAVTLVMAMIFFMPSDLILVSKSIFANAVFGANILFWRTSGYFDNVSGINPLLHTWSLAVEEQFYLFLPILLIWISRYKRFSAVSVLVFFTFLSFLSCIFIQLSRPNATFYLLPFRAWELGAGSILACLVGRYSVSKLQGNVLSIIGLGLVLGSCILLSESREFPGWIAAFPVVGTALLIYAGQYQMGIVSRLLSCRPLVFIGLLSYSLYLWHWPVYAFTLYLNSFEPLGNLSFFAAGIVFSLSYLTYRFVEVPVRSKKLLVSNRSLINILITFFLLILSVAFYSIWSGGIPSRFPSKIVKLDLDRNPEIPYIDCVGNKNIDDVECILGDRGEKPRVLLWGDSHALSWAPLLDHVSKSKHSIMFTYYSACPPLLDVINPIVPKCKVFNDEIFRLLASNAGITQVVLHASWLSYSMQPGQYEITNSDGQVGNLKVFPVALKETVSRIQKLGIDVTVLGPTPSAPNDITLKKVFNAFDSSVLMPSLMSSEMHRNRASSFYSTAGVVINEVGIRVIDPAQWLCDLENCKYELNDVVIYRDNGHLIFPGILEMADMPGINMIIR